jgi:PAS domain S-box-containing protein
VVVAVGASAGGLEALEDLFREMDPGLPAAFLVQQHMPPDAESRMDELLQRITRLTVRTAEDGAIARPGHVLVAPPSQELGIRGGRVRITPRDPALTVAHPIDHLFCAVASDRKADAIGIVLSGTGNDGARGSREIRAAGGTVLVQEPASARFDGMPNAAIAAGAVDHVLLPEQMVAAVAALLERRSTGSIGQTAPDPALGNVLFALRAGFGVDFAHYKPTTVARRVGRRMSLRAIPSLPSYVELLRGDPQELASLYHDLLIGVTQFFRDAQAFDLLGRTAIDALFSELGDEELRAWVPGCATGEEAYSIAMLLDERRRALDRRNTIRVFATDLHGASVHTASVGLYPPGALTPIGEARRKRYFRPQGDGWMRVAPHLREMVVFATHDLLADAPFTRLHLLSCRNLLVYLQPVAQRHVLGHFHVALRDRGVLFLGPCETPGPLESEFEPIARAWKIYRKRRDVGARLQRRTGTRATGPRRLASGPHRIVPSPVTPMSTGVSPLGLASPAQAGSVDPAELSRDYVGTLESELRFAQSNLQATIEELETSNEELKASNEELASANEELQSTNEELHSLNEELFALDTEHRRKIEELGELTDDLDHLLQGIDVGVLFLDRELRVRRFTARLAATFHLQPQDVGRPLAEIASDIDGIAVIDDAIRVLETGQAREREVTDRTGVHRLLRAMPYRSGERAQGVVITLVDISSLRHAQADVQRLSAIVEHTQDAVISKTLRGVIVSWNEAATRLYGFTAAEAIGQNIKFILPPELHGDMEAVLRRLASGERIEEMETRRQRKDGTVIDVSATISPVRAKDGRIVGASSISRDITRRKAAEAQVRLAVEQRERFLATLSHELRNPVMAISSAAEVLRDQAMAEPWALKAAEVVLRQKDHMAHLLEDLLDVSRIRENKIEMHREVFDLRHTVDDAASDLEPRMEAAGLRLVRHGGERPCWVLGDRTRLRQVVANLLTNALKFSPPSTQVDLALEEHAAEVALRIRDRGIGLDDETRARIFEPFFQGRPGDGRGLGLGLALVAAIVEAHEGRIDVASDGVGHGCEFTVVLPLSGPPERDEAPAVAPVARPSPPPRRVLIVEDQPDNRMLLEFLLAARGYEVTTAGGVADAIACLQSRPIDVAIVDIGLPDGPGHDVARAARAIAPEDRLLLVALTGHGQPGDRAAAKDAGFQHHLVKPVEVDVLVRLIEDHHHVLEPQARRVEASTSLET